MHYLTAEMYHTCNCMNLKGITRMMIKILL